MANFQNINRGMLPTMPQQRADMLNQVGINVTNPVEYGNNPLNNMSQSQPQFSRINVHKGMRNNPQFSSFSNQEQTAINTIRNTLNKADEQLNRNIIRGADVNTFGGTPQSTAQDLMAYLETDTPHVIDFDIETIPSDPAKFGGDVSPQTQSPIEMHFESGVIDGSFHRKGKQTILISPEQEVEESLHKIRNKIQSGGPTNLNQGETALLDRLVRYSDMDMDTAQRGEISFTGNNYEKLIGSPDRETNLIRNVNAETIDAAEEGLEKVRRVGDDPDVAASKINKFLKQHARDDSFLAGHNIANFDVPSVERFLSSHVEDSFSMSNYRKLDTLRVTNDIAGSDLGRTLGESALKSKQRGNRLADLSSALGVSEEEVLRSAGPNVSPHDSPYDVNKHIQVIENMFHKSDNQLQWKQRLDSRFDLTGIKSGDRLFADRGFSLYPGTDEYQGAVEKGYVGLRETADGEFVPQRRIMTSSTPYEFVGLRQADDYNVAMLQDLTTDENVYIGHQDFDELSNLFHDNMTHFDEKFSEMPQNKALQKAKGLKQKQLQDTARSKWRRIMSGADTDSYDKLKRMLDVYEQEEVLISELKDGLMNVDNIGPKRAESILDQARKGQIQKMQDIQKIRGIGDKVFNNIQSQSAVKNKFNELMQFQDQGVREGFTFMGSGDNAVTGNWPEHYRMLRDRIDAEYGPLRNIVDTIDSYDHLDVEGFAQQYSGDDLTSSAEFWNRKLNRHVATSQALQEYRENIGGYTQLENMPGHKRKGIDLLDPLTGRRKHTSINDLASEVNFKASKARNFEDVSYTKIDPNITTRNMIEDTADQVRAHHSLQADVLNVQSTYQETPQAAAEKLSKTFRSHSQIMPDYFGADKRIAQIRRMTEQPGSLDADVIGKQVDDFFDMVRREQGLKGSGFARLGQKEVDAFTGELEDLAQRVGRGDIQTGTAAQQFQEIVRDKSSDKFWGFGRRYREVESLTGENIQGLEQTDPVSIAQRKVDELGATYHSPLKKGTTTDNIFRSGFDNKLTQQVDYLDKNLRTIHEQLNISNKPATMRETLDRFTQQLDTQLNDQISYSMFLQGDTQDPKIRMAMYDTSKFQTIKSSLTPEGVLDRDDVVSFDIPLISEDQYINVGGRQRVAPAAIGDIDPALRQKGREGLRVTRDDMVVRSPFDVILGDAFDMDRKLAMSREGSKRSRVITKLNDYILDNRYREAESVVSRNFNKAASRMVGSMGAGYGEDPTSLYTGFRADLSRKRSVVMRRIFEDPESGTLHDLEGNPLYPGGGLQDFYRGAGKYDTDNMYDLASDLFGKDIDVSLGTTRGKHLSQMVLGLGDARDLTPFSYYSNPGRPNIMQRMNLRPMSEDMIDSYRASDSISIDPMVSTPQDNAIRNAAAYNQAGAPTDMQVPGVRSKARTIDSADIYAGTFDQQVRQGTRKSDSLIEILRQKKREGFESDLVDIDSLISDVSEAPSMWEDQVILSESIAFPEGDRDALIAQRPRSKTITGELQNYEDMIGKKLEYGEKIGDWKTGGELTNEYRAARRVEDINVVDGQTKIDMVEEYKMRPGVTKVMAGSEKGTVRTVLPDEIMQEWLGDDVHIGLGSGYRSHMNFGDILEGYTSQAVRNINKAKDLNVEQKKQYIKQIGESINQNFAKADEQLSLSVERSRQNSENLTLIMDQTHFKQKIQPEDFDEFVGGLRNIHNKAGLQGDFDPGVLDLELRFMDQDENLHFLSMDKKLGKKGARFSTRELESVENMLNYEGRRSEVGKWLEGQIIKHGKAGDRQAFEEGLAFHYMSSEAAEDVIQENKLANLPDNIDDLEQYVSQQDIDAEVLSYKDLDERFPRKLGQSPIGQKGQSRYLYRKGDLANTPLDPDAGAAFVTLPENVEVNVGHIDDESQQAVREVNKLFMPGTDIGQIEQGADLYTSGDLGKHRRDIIEDLKSYRQAQQQADVAGETTDDVMTRLQRHVQDYYDDLSTKMMASGQQGGMVDRQVLGTRLPGSGRAKLQIVSPALEMAGMDETELAKIQSELGQDVMGKLQEQGFDDLTDIRDTISSNIQGTGLEAVDDPTLAYISEDRARDMLQGTENIDDIIQNMKTKGRGQEGFMFRPPTIHEQSAMPVHFKIGQSLDDDTVRMPSSLAGGYFGDADGDNISFGFVTGVDKEKFHEDIDRTRQQLKRSGQDGARTGAMVDMLEDMAEGDPNQIIREKAEEGFVERFDVDHLSRGKMFDRVSQAKTGRVIYTGSLTNVAEHYRNIGTQVFEGDQKKMSKFRSAIGKVIEEPISSKHAMTGGAARTKGAGVDPGEVLETLKGVSRGDRAPIDIADSLGPEGMGLFDSMEAQAVREAAEADPDAFRDMSNELFQSTRALRQNRTRMWESINQGDAVPTEQKRMFAEQYYDEIVSKAGFEGDRAAEHLKERTEQLKEAGKAANEYGKQKQAEKTRGGISPGKISGLADDTMQAMPKIGKMKAGAILGAGVMAGSMATSGSRLPMDSYDDPGLNPVPDTADRSTTLNIGEEQATDIMAARTEENRIVADRTRSSIGQMDLSQHANLGYEVSVSGQSTIDRSPDELAGVVERAMHETTEVPMSINVNTTDNREDIDERWLEQRMMNMIS